MTPAESRKGRGQRVAMDLSSLSLDTFLCASACVAAAEDPGAFDLVGPIVAYLVADHFRSLGEGLALHHMTSGPGDVGLLSGATLIGFYFDDLLAVNPAYAGRRLSLPVILAAVPCRPVPERRSLSPAGRASLAFAWRVAHGFERNPWP